MEIYNEKVRDLLKDGTERQNLPLLDDPERGTVAEGLSEEWPRSEQHLCQLLRQIETRRTVSHLNRLHYAHLLCVPVYQQLTSPKCIHCAWMHAITMYTLLTMQCIQLHRDMQLT